MNLQEFYSRYLEYTQVSHSQATHKSVKYAFDNMLAYFGSDIDITTISMDRCEMFLLSSYKHTKYGAALFLRTLKAAFNKAIHWKLVDSNPFKNIRLPKIARRHPAFIDKNQLQDILDNTPNKDLCDIYESAFHTGMRISELLSIQWSNVDMFKRILIVRNTEEFTTKSKLERVIPINLPFYSILERLQERKHITGPYVFRQYNKFYISHTFRKVVDSLNLSKDIHLHSLRHSFASNLVNKGASLYVVKELMGHADYKTTQIYAHLQREALEDAVKLLN